MPEETPIITGYHGVYFAVDPRGRRLEFERRYSACFIVTLRGKIRFRYEGGCVTADPAHPVFLPQGLRYVNECLESAESYVFNFYTLRDGSPAELSAVTAAFAEERYQLLKNAGGLPLILRELYTLSCALFSPRPASVSEYGVSGSLFEDALGICGERPGIPLLPCGRSPGTATSARDICGSCSGRNTALLPSGRSPISA